ncbi:hypothetical protein CYLTODRAFT_337237, partial [Cylindrobasidium torrendii FP15055 ss-10]
GLIPCAATATKKRLCVSIRTLEVFRRLRLRSPRLSAQGYVHGLCDLQDRVGRRVLVQQFTTAFDFYQSMKTRLDTLVDKQLGRSGHRWRLQNACPCCLYKTQQNAPLLYDLLYAMDGNNSLKRVEKASKKKDAAGNALPVESIERTDSRMEPSAGADGDSSNTPGDPTGYFIPRPKVEEEKLPCEERWHNMTHDAASSSWSIYAETGLFAATCHHGMVLVVADMVRSGELAKYPLAAASVIEDALPDIKKVAGFDCGCKLSKTARRSDLRKALDSKTLRMVVGAFHGFAHNRLCQLRFLPRYIQGLGLTDFEVLERLFSKSNALAPVTRHSSAFHRRQFVAAYFAHIDRIETYQSLSKQLLIANQVRDALANLSMGGMLQELMARAGMSNSKEFHAQLADEEAYLNGLVNAPPSEATLRMEYAGALNSLELAQEDLLAARNCCVLAGPVPNQALEQQRRTVENRVVKFEGQALHLEKALGLPRRWNKNDAEYKQANVNIVEREYKLAVNHLEALVVSRIFELTKMNMSQTGYKMRKQIEHAVQARSKAIRNALARYNKAADSAGRKKLDWSEVVQYSFLAQFDMLRGSAEDVRTKPWATPHGRQAIDLYFKMARSHEQLIRSQNEATNLLTFMKDDEAYLQKAYLKLRETDTALAFQVRRRYRFQVRMNDEHRTRLAAI